MKKVIFNPECQEKLMEGVEILAHAVGSTLGPKGNNVVIETPYGTSTVTKDGVTVAKHINLDDPIQNMGCDIVKQASQRTANTAGDGTTSSTVLAYHLAKNGLELIKKGVAPISVKRGYENYLKDALEILSTMAIPVTTEEIKQVATISANNDETLGELIHTAVTHASGSGLVTVADSKTDKTYVSTINGSMLDRGFLSPYFITDPEKGQAIYESPLFLITDKKLRSTNDVIPAMEAAVKAGKPLVIIADEVEAGALQLLILNKMHGKLNTVAIKAPAFGARRLEILEDLAALTSATLISELKGERLEDVNLSHLGSANSVIVSAEETLIVGPNSADLTDRLLGIRNLLNQSPNDYDFEKLSQRLSLLEGKVSTIYVGASTETELKEKKDRIDDALRATRAATEKGYVIGGGYALIDVALQLYVTDPIGDIFVDALLEPAKLIRENAGHKVRDILLDYQSHGTYNSHNGEYEDLMKAGVIDPALVTEQALTNAVSAANMILLSTTAVYSSDRKSPYNPGNLEDYK